MPEKKEALDLHYELQISPLNLEGYHWGEFVKIHRLLCFLFLDYDPLRQSQLKVWCLEVELNIINRTLIL